MKVRLQRLMRLPKLELQREKAGVISEMPVWILWDMEYMYVHPTLLGLLWVVVTQWRDYRHIVG